MFTGNSTREPLLNPDDNGEEEIDLVGAERRVSVIVRRNPHSGGGVVRETFDEAPLPALTADGACRAFRRYFAVSPQDIPIAQWLPAYSLSLLGWDALGGVSVTVLLIPQSMAYAALAGLPAIYGLYSGGLPLVAYALLSSSSQLAVGPVGPPSILLNQLVSQLEYSSDEERYRLTIALGMVCGLVLALGGILRLGFVANLLSKPVTSGFVTAAAFIITASQLGSLLGLDSPSSNSFFVTVYNVFAYIGTANWRTVVVGLPSLVVLASFKHWHKLYLWPCSQNKSPPPRWIPIQLVIVVAGILISYFARLDEQGVEVVGTVPEGFPAPSFPIQSGSEFFTLLPPAILLAVVGYVGTISLGVAFGKKVGETISANMEMGAQGFASIVGGFFASIPPSGSFTRTALNSEMGSKTPMAGAITGVLMIIVLVAVAKLFEPLPITILAAMVIASCQSLLMIDDAKAAWKTRAGDFFEFWATFVLTLVLGVGNGIVAAIGLSIVLLLLRALRPKVHQLGQLPGTDYFVDLSRYKAAEVDPHTLVLRIDGELNFGNIKSVAKRLYNVARAVEIRRHHTAEQDDVPLQHRHSTVSSRHVSSATSRRELSLADVRGDLEADGGEGPSLPLVADEIREREDSEDSGEEAEAEEGGTLLNSLRLGTGGTPPHDRHPLDPAISASLPRAPAKGTWWSDPLDLQVVVLDFSRVTSVDVTTCEELLEVHRAFRKIEVPVRLAGVTGSVRDTIRRYQTYQGDEATEAWRTRFLSVDAAIRGEL